MKRTAISDKLREIAAAIEQRGSVNLTRLTVIKKWFEVPSHLSSFAIFIADHAVSWDELGRMLMSFEGWQFRVVICDRSEEV